MKLTHTEELFVAEYLKNRQNGTKAYLAIKPDSSPRAASVSATRLLKMSAVIEAIQNMINKKSDESIASREYLINDADEIGKEAREKGAYGSALTAVEIKWKLNRLFERIEKRVRDMPK